MQQFPPERVRNFGIIAHVDHGKSTLADRLMQVRSSAAGCSTQPCRCSPHSKNEPRLPQAACWRMVGAIILGLVLLQMTGAISAGSQAQYLDKLQVERERGITVKVGRPHGPRLQ